MWVHACEITEDNDQAIKLRFLCCYVKFIFVLNFMIHFYIKVKEEMRHIKF